jgi:hypothetical protein
MQIGTLSEARITAFRPHVFYLWVYRDFRKKIKLEIAKFYFISNYLPRTRPTPAGPVRWR